MSYVDISRYRVNEPYPIISVIRENRSLASLLQDDYAGVVSEYTSISQFIYGYIISDEADLSDDFLGMAMVEMTHLDLIGDVIKQLGGNPVFRSGNGIVWNSNVLAYSNSTKNRLRLCTRIKQRSLDQYRAHVNRVSDPDIKSLLQRIILDEELHLQILKEHLDKYRIKRDDDYKDDDYYDRRNDDRYDNRSDDKYDNRYNDRYDDDYDDDNNDNHGTPYPNSNNNNNINADTNTSASNDNNYNNSQYDPQDNQNNFNNDNNYGYSGRRRRRRSRRDDDF